MKGLIGGLEREYTKALFEFIDSSSEEDLRRAYELGRKALVEGLSAMDLASIHYEALAGFFSHESSDCARLLRLGGSFLVESLSAFEMAQRGFREALIALREKTRELERSNSELDMFASIAAHDLQEPLRKIIAFGDMLKTRHGDALGGEGKNYLERMRKAAARMSMKTQDLLQYSRLSTMGRVMETVDLRAIIEEVLGDLEARIAESKGEVKIGKLPALRADTMQMRQLFQNLLSNALKFRRKNEPPKVSIQCLSSEKGMARIAVSDNGIGFDEKYLDRIFKPFQRLHGQDEYEGTGIGLAICKKIVERHGGTIGARSAPGEGSTFLFTLPLAALPGSGGH